MSKRQPDNVERKAERGHVSASDRSRGKQWLFRGLAVCLSVVMCLGCLEIGLRIWGPKNRRLANVGDEYYSNPRGYFRLRRHERGEAVYGIPVTGAGAPPQRIPDGMDDQRAILDFLSRNNTILGLGDSFTVGRGVRWEDTYLRRLEERLAKDGLRIGINNAARAGYDLPRIIDVYEAHAQRRYYPLVLYGFVLNDFGLPDRDSIIGLDFIDFNSGEYAVSPWRQRFATVNFVGHVIDTIRLDRSTKAAYLSAFEGPNAERGYKLLASLNRRVEENGGQLVIVLFPLLYEFHDYPFQTIHDKIAAFCQREQIPLLDLLPAFSKCRAKELWVHPVDHHPNEIAHRIAAEEIYAFLKQRGLLEATMNAVSPTGKMQPAAVHPGDK